MFGKMFGFFAKKKMKKEVKKTKKGIKRVKQVFKKAINMVAKKVVDKTK